jgi:superfamily I DNA/RNA helicase/mRNA-degrading endonuclease RelE of RelBE toxin-antitoxin system
MNNVAVAISQDFMVAFSQVTKKQQKKVLEFVTKFRKDPRSSGINYEKINDSKEKNYRSVRIDQDYRGIILKPDSGNIFLLLWVDKHDDAYDWARRHSCSIDAATGALEIYESQHIAIEADIHTDRNPVFHHESKSPADRLINIEPQQLERLGVPEKYIKRILEINLEDELEQLESVLTKTAYEALFLLAAGAKWKEIENEYCTNLEVVDTSDYLAAIQRVQSKRTFFVPESEGELLNVLDAPLEFWRVFLHPSQRHLIERDWNGPIRVLGGAGTGKTVVAMHRAKWLAEKLDHDKSEKILFTTFSTNLAIDIRQSLKKICSPATLNRIDVINIDKWISDYLKSNNYPYTIVFSGSNDRYEQIWTEALQLNDEELCLPESFYNDEWQRTILPNNIRTKSEYLAIPRLGRGVPLNRKERARIWPIFASILESMDQNGLKTLEQATFDAIELVKQNSSTRKYASIVVDEAQDMGPESLSLIRELITEKPNDLFLVGDGHQRIYRRRATMSACGINIIGRGKKLKINYRTTEQTKRFAVSILENCHIDDLDGEQDSSVDYISLTKGTPPKIFETQSTDLESKYVIEQIEKLISEGISTNDICIVARIKKPLELFARALSRRKITSHILDRHNDNSNIPGVRLSTMHRIKGLEFHYIFIVAANENIIPLYYSTSGTEDGIELRDLDFNERALLHVASTRAVKQLYISSSGQLSPYVKPFIT